MENDLTLWNSLDNILQINLNRIDKTGIGKLNRLAKNAFDEIKEIGFKLSAKKSKIELLEGSWLYSRSKDVEIHN